MTQDRAVIFDCDGVLLDSEPIGLEALHRAVKTFQLPFKRDELKRFCGITDHESLRTMCKESHMDIDEKAFIDKKNEYYLEILENDGVKPFPGVRELLEDLTISRVKVAVASSAPRTKVLAGLISNNLLEYFNAVVTGDDIARGKPMPDIFLKAAEQLGVHATDCIVVEDTVVGVLAGMAATMKVYAVTNTFPAEAFTDYSCIVVDTLEGLDTESIMTKSP
jgi:HAD superfamily hydrolase (TIGR01509 family)